MIMFPIITLLNADNLKKIELTTFNFNQDLISFLDVKADVHDMELVSSKLRCWCT